jgi:hypothetical protein
MSFEEKTTWTTALVQLVVAIWYAVRVVPQLASTPVADIEYRGPLLGMVVASIGLTIVASILLAGTIATRAAVRGEATDVDRSDERDRSISRWAGNIGGTVLAVAVVPALVLTLFEVEHFWIAQSLVAALVLSELVTAGLRIYRYRRGF